MVDALILGEALIDRLPTGPVAAGAPLNVARHLQRLGCAPLMVSRVGNADADAARIEAAFRDAGLILAGVQRDAERPTGAVDVLMDAAGGHRFVIANDAAWDHLDRDAAFAAVQGLQPRLVYFGTLAQRHAVSRHAIRALLGASSAPRFLDLNLREGVADIVALCEASMHLADWVKVNDEELARLGAWFGTSNAPSLMRRFALRRLVLTRGAAGYAAWEEAEQVAEGPGVAIDRFVDTVGAGDAFSAFLLAAHLHGRDFAASLRPANAFAAAICGERGAAPAEPARFYPPWREELDALPKATPA